MNPAEVAALARMALDLLGRICLAVEAEQSDRMSCRRSLFECEQKYVQLQLRVRELERAREK